MTPPASPAVNAAPPAAFAAGPLQGVRIVDLTTVVLGPYATRILADMGADVIKVETFGGDQTRHYLPMRNPGMSGYFINLNRNKRSIALDLKKPEALAALKKLVAGAHAFVHNMRPQAAARLGLDYGEVRALNEGIVYCAATGFGTTGPYAGKAAYDDVIQAASGLAALNARVHGEPAYAPTVLCDKLTGQAVAYAMLGALYQQARGGGGQAVEVPMLETSAEFALVEHLHGATFEPPLSEMGFARVLSRFRKPYRTADGYICLLPYSDDNWRDFFRFTGRTQFEGDARFARLADRVQHIDVLYGLVAEEAPRHTNAQWAEFCHRVSIPCMPVLGLEDLEGDEHLRAVGLFRHVEHPSEGTVRLVRSPVTFAAPFTLRHHAPRLGEQSAQVLREAGYGDAEIGAMVDAASVLDGAEASTVLRPRAQR